MIFARTIVKIILARSWSARGVIRRDLHLRNNFILGGPLEGSGFNLKKFEFWNGKKLFSSTKSAISELNLKKFFINVEAEYMSYSRKSGDYAEILSIPMVTRLLDERAKILENIKCLSEISEQDKEMVKLVEEEKLENENRLEQIENEFLETILDNYIGDNCNDVVLELNAGVGGQESMLFLGELLEMYQKHFEYLGFTHHLIEVQNAAQGGVRHASMTVSGKYAMEILQHEAGVHRVQRIPATERTGRIHTSVISVTVLPQPTEIEISINPKDLRIDTMRASGAGGQHVNTTNSAVRVTHFPSGIVVECQTERSAFTNQKLALIKLRTKLYERAINSQTLSATTMRKKQMGSRLRNEKIRTYNYNQDRVTDHRISNGTMYNLKGFLEGGEALDKLHKRLRENVRQKFLLDLITGNKTD